MNQTIEIEVDGQVVTGKITHRDITDLGIIITSPFTGFNSGSHISNVTHSAHPNGFIDEYGEIRAKQLLKSLYQMLREFNERKEELRQLVKPYQQQVDAVDQYTKEEYLADRKDLRRRFRAGEMDNKQYGQEQMNLKRRWSKADTARALPKINFLMEHFRGKATICDVDWIWTELTQNS